jgi:GT2 family glycosyltransferase
MSRSEDISDWTAWFPWSQGESLPPAAVISGKQPPIPTYEPHQVAVVIPVGPEHRELVVDALDSVDAQGFRDWECIVVNDSGSPLRWTPSWARVIDTHKAFDGPVGVAKARNVGIAASGAPLFVPLDADDTLEPSALAEMLRVWHDFGGYVYPDFYEKWEGRDIKVWETSDYDAMALLRQGCLHAVTGLFARADWERVGGYNEELPAWEDWDFQLRLAKVGVCGTRIPEPLFVYRKDTGSRREENYANFDAGKFAMLANWQEYFEGKERLMGCGCSGGRAPAANRAPRVDQQPAPQESEAYIVVEYIGRKTGAMTFRGPSGQSYRFAAADTERQKYVRRDDAEFFEAKVDFRISEMETPVPA